MTEKVTPKQARGIAALLTESTLTAAAAVAGVSPKTLYKWLKQPAFTAELRRVQGQEIDQAAARLSGGLPDALDELKRLMTSAKSEATRRAAVADWLGLALKLREHIELAARVSALEERTK